MEGSDPQPRMAVARVGVRGRPAQCRPGPRQHPVRGHRRGRGAGHRVRRTGCSSPASRCSCSRPCRRRCSPGSAASPHPATSPSSAAACGACSSSSSAVGVVGSLGALAIGPFVLEKVYDAELDGVTLGHPGGRQRVLHGRPRSRSGGDRPQGSLARRPRLGHRCGRPGDRSVVRAATTCSAVSRSACSPRRSRR